MPESASGPSNAADEQQPVRVWDRVDGELVERSGASPALRECVALGLWWVVVPSAHGPLLRLARDRDGKVLLPTADEERIRLAEAAAAEIERLRAELARLRGDG